MEATFTDTSWNDYLPVWSSNGSQPYGPSQLLGRYRILNKMCDVIIGLSSGSSGSGGTGALFLTLPAVVDGTAGLEQYIFCKTYIVGVGNFQGVGYAIPGTNQLQPNFPVDNGHSVMTNWSSSSNGSLGSGVPAIGGRWTLDNCNFVACGRYRTI